ncbi:zeta toxin family protein [Mycolicibacterium lutetiense]
MSSPADPLRDAVAAELVRLTADGGLLAPDSPRGTHKVFVNDPRRAQVRKRIVNDYLAPAGTLTRDGTAVITAGAPGAGKSWALDTVLGSSKAGYRRLDADIAKDHILTDALGSGLFDDLLGATLGDGQPIAPRELASLVHHESVQIWDALRRHCIGRGEPIIIEGTLKWPPLGAQLLGELHQGGYTTVRIVAVDVPEQVAQARAIGRWWDVRSAGTDPLGGRFTPPDAISRTYRPDGTCICIANAAALIAPGSEIPEGMTITLDVVDETGTLTSSRS